RGIGGAIVPSHSFSTRPDATLHIQSLVVDVAGSKQWDGRDLASTGEKTVLMTARPAILSIMEKEKELSMAKTTQRKRPTLSTFLALALTLLAVNAASPAHAAEDAAPQAICEDTGWRQVGTWIGEYNSPWFYSGGYTNIQFKGMS